MWIPRDFTRTHPAGSKTPKGPDSDVGTDADRELEEGDDDAIFPHIALLWHQCQYFSKLNHACINMS
jgi:hypothetical protein